MSTKLPKMPISTGEKSIISVEKVPKSIGTAEKVRLWIFGRKWAFLGESPRITVENSSVAIEKIRIPVNYREHLVNLCEVILRPPCYHKCEALVF